jgi:hypothetical protein
MTETCQPIAKNHFLNECLHGVAQVVRPYGIVDADGILRMPGRIEPLRSGDCACFLTVVWLIRVANRTRWNAFDQCS